MSLMMFQRTIKDLIYTKDGRLALQSPEHMQAFVEKRDGLNTSEKQYLLLMSTERLRKYSNKHRQLFDSMLTRIFPFTKLLLKPDWEMLLMEYMETYPASSFRLFSVSEKFPEFLESIRKTYYFPAALPELALFELLEGQILNTPDWEKDDMDSVIKVVPETVDELSSYCPVLNPVSRLIRFQYPVHSLCGTLGEMPQTELEGATWRCNIIPEETWILGYLQEDSGQYEYSVQTPLMAVWLQHLANIEPRKKITYQESMQPLMTAIKAQYPEFGPEDEPGFYEEFLLSIQDFGQFGILSGSLPV